MEAKLKCDRCGYEMATPHHCDRPMHTQQVSGETKLACWMGPECGVAEIPKHCGAPMHEKSAAQG